MMENREERDLGAMVTDFVLHAGGSEEFAVLCRRLFESQEAGSVCLPIDDENERETVKSSALVSMLPDDAKLFVFDDKRNLFYTRRNWQYEHAVRTRIVEMASGDASAPLSIPGDDKFAALKACQRNAIRIMTSRRFSILTGGPGTGKTYTLARAVELLQAQTQGTLRIALAAPTGKAAAKVRETMTGNGIEVSTLHALLKPRHDFVTFQRNAASPLVLDWLIVDEAGMISLPLMAKLLDALDDRCRLTLVGDAAQLASVEPGRIFGDLGAMPEVQPCVAELTESTRFQNAKEIFDLAGFVRSGDGENALELLRRSAPEKVLYQPFGEADDPVFRENVLHCWQPFSEARTAEAALNALNDCRILCALHKGLYGTERINAFMLKLFRDSPVPVMVVRNDPALGVSNGDVGVVMPGDPERFHWLRDGRAATLPLSLLPGLETAFATTIHKSQGSEYDNVFIVLPPGQSSGENSGLLTRELLYTAITRAKKRILLFADDESVRSCCRHPIRRRSGLQVIP